MAEQPKVQQTFNTPVTEVAGNVESNQNVYAPEQKQTLAEAAAEIQDLLKQLKNSTVVIYIGDRQRFNPSYRNLLVLLHK